MWLSVYSKPTSKTSNLEEIPKNQKTKLNYTNKPNPFQIDHEDLSLNREKVELQMLFPRKDH